MSDKDEFPLYPELPDEGGKEAQALVDRFKEQLKEVADEAIGGLYIDVAFHIESDSWGNYRNQLMDGLTNYGNRKLQGEHDFKKIRQSILANHREEIIADLNQDLVEEVESLKKQIEQLYKNRDIY